LSIVNYPLIILFDMDAIYIPQLLKMQGKKEEIKFEEMIPGLKTLTPVRGIIVVAHKGTFLEISATAETIMTLTCDRCLQNYNHKLAINAEELIWLEKEPEESDNIPLEREVSLDDLSETLPPDGYFSPDTWLYEQLCLALPMQQLCGKNCQFPTPNGAKEDLIDSRWASLASLKQQISPQNSHELQ
jgi:uncharacterized protein